MAADEAAGELVAEFQGTFVIIAFGDGVVAMVVAALNQSGRGDSPLADQLAAHRLGLGLRRGVAGA